MRIALAVLLLAALIALPAAAPAQKKDWYERAVKKVEATFEPAEAKPGQTVTFRLTVHLNDGFHTYPTRQPDKNARDMVNAIEFPAPGAVVFVGDVTDPPKPKTKSEPVLGIAEYHIHEGKVVYERTAVVSPTAKPGPVEVKVPVFKLNVCDAINCFPTKKLTPAATLKLLDGPAVPVDPRYADEVRKAGG
jgi:hypothetical protein